MLAMWLCLIAIVVSIVIGWKFKQNTGIIAMVCAFVIGIGVMGMKAGDIINFWPTTIVFYLISISLFFTYANDNGTMDVLGHKILYALNGNAKLIPLAIFLVSLVVGGLGAGASTPVIVGPFLFLIGLSANVNPVLIAVCIGYGNTIGSGNIYNGYGGMISKSLIEACNYSASEVNAAGNFVWLNSCIAFILSVVILYIFYKGYKAKRVAVEKPEAFNPLQKKTMVIVLIAFAFMVVPALLNAWVKNDVVAAVANFCQPQVIMFIGALVCVLMKIGDEKKVIKSIPINTIVMIVGVYTLICVAKEAGLVDAMASLLSGTIPKFLVPAFLILFAAFLSFFSSCTSTVMPLMYPLVPGLAASLGLNPVMLFACIYIGGLSTAMSPFSTGGALTIASCADKDVKENVLPNGMIVASLVIPLICAVLATIGVFSFFHI